MCDFRHNAKIVLFPLTNENRCAYNEDTNTDGRSGQMAENLLQEIERRLQRMTEEQKKIVLAALGEPDDICKQECEAV